MITPIWATWLKNYLLQLDVELYHLLGMAREDGALHLLAEATMNGVHVLDVFGRAKNVKHVKLFMACPDRFMRD